MSRKPTGKKTRSSASSKSNVNRFLLVVTLLIFVVTAAAIAAHFLIPRRKAPLPEKPAAKAIATAPHYEIFPKEPSRRIPPVSPSPPSKILPRALPKPEIPPTALPKPEILPGALPKVAIIIDDMGFDQIMTRKFIELDAVLTYSILPFSPLQAEIQEAATKKRLDTMLHLPMEPIEYPTINPGRGALLTTMSPDELIDQLKKNLRAVPGIVGVNNHMGSKMTEVSDQLNQIFSVLKKEGVFFIDSRTSPASLCRPAARLFRIPFGERDIFLDHIQKPEIIREQILQLIRVAIERGEAIGIGHPHSVTYDVLLEMLPGIIRKVKLVPASEVVHLQS
ncbi:MAG: divergent polysaccharide deacetylase family protein [Pseudomonadota bacterium]